MEFLKKTILYLSLGCMIWLSGCKNELPDDIPHWSHQLKEGRLLTVDKISWESNAMVVHFTCHWEYFADPSVVKGFCVYKDGSKRFSFNKDRSWFGDTGLTPGVTHQYQLAIQVQDGSCSSPGPPFYYKRP